MNSTNGKLPSPTRTVTVAPLVAPVCERCEKRSAIRTVFYATERSKHKGGHVTQEQQNVCGICLRRVLQEKVA